MKIFPTKMVRYMRLQIRDGNVIGTENIPTDGKMHKITLENPEGQTATLYAKKDAKGVVWYTKTNGDYMVLPKNMTLVDYTERKVGTVVAPCSKEGSATPIVEGFLSSISPDFAELKNLIDRDMVLGKLLVRSKGQEEHDHTGSNLKGDIPKGDIPKGEGKPSSHLIEKPLWKVDADETLKTRVIKGFMQSGKTWIMISMAMWYFLKYRMPVVIIIQNSLDACDQLMSRVNSTFEKFFAKLDEKSAEEVFRILDVKRGKTADDKEFRQAMTGTVPKIFVALRSDYDIQPITTIIEKLSVKRFVMIIDESDFNDSGTDSIAQDAIEGLKKLASLVWNVSATPMGSLMKEAVDCGNVYIMRKPENYKDLPNMDIRSLKKPAEYCSGVNDNPFEKDPNLKDYIHDFAKTKPFPLPFWGGQRHPRMSLVRLGQTIEPQLRVASYIYSKYKERITVITYNGSGHGLTLRGQTLPQEPIKLSDGTESTYTRGNNIHSFSGCHIGRVIEYLQNNGGTERYPRIIILAGKMADRGITFGSTDYTECIKKKKVPWHLTELYFIVARNMTQSNLLQGAGRLCGVFVDPIPLTIFSNASADIIKSYHEQEELIARARELSAFGAEKRLMKERIPEVPISREKCVRRRITPAAVPCRLKKVKDDSQFGGWDWKAEGRIFAEKKAVFGEGSRAESVRESLSEDEILRIRDEKPESKEEGELTKEELADLRKKFEKWAEKRNTKISRFMAEGVDPRKRYTGSEFVRLCAEYTIEPSHMFNAVYAKSRGYGRIFKRGNGVVYMHPELIEVFSKYF